MRLNVTLRRSASDSVDLVAQFDASATIGDLARAMAERDPTGVPQSAGGETAAVTLTIQDSGTALDPESLVGESALASGQTVSLVRAGPTAPTTGPEGAAAILRVVAGPDKGLEVGLRPGASTIGRDPACEIVLTDPMVSRRHARLVVGESVEVLDQGSANGVIVGGTAVSRTALRAGDLVTLGDSALTVRATGIASTRTQGIENFIRSPRVVPQFEGAELEAPPPPERSRRQRFPTIALLAPLLMGALLYAITRNVTSILFVALSPLLLVGSAVESRMSARKDFEEEVAGWRGDIQGMTEALRDLLRHEVAARQCEHPSTADLVLAARKRDVLLWSRRPDRDGFCELRLGSGECPSRTNVSLPRRNKAPFELVSELEAVVASCRTVVPVPVSAQLSEGAVGVAGSRSDLLGYARALLAQAAILHSPSELIIAAALGSETAQDWRWLLWLPHVASVHSPLSVSSLTSSPLSTGALVSELDALIDERVESELTSPAVLVVIESGAPAEHSRLVAVAERGPSVGVFVIWLADETTSLPAACASVVQLGGREAGATAANVREGSVVELLETEQLDQSGVETLARSLAPIVDAGARADDASDLPRTVSQFAIIGATLGEKPEAVIERWMQNNSILNGPFAPSPLPKKAGNLRAVIGQSAEGQHALDLRVDGPHALVGGTTGAGKSELLQSWLLGLAADHSPDRVTFLLVDYKGGAAFSECVMLPHTIGLVTDLSQHMVRRALTSLTAELRYREALLAEHKAKDLIELESHGVVGAPPNLIIVVDEFAALKSEVPEFVDGVVNVAQRGRSLGLHLILATQRPQGVITGNLRANTNLRVALRMADAADSMDVLGTEVAATFDPDQRGRAVSKSGPKRLVSFQTAYTGGWTSDEPPVADVAIEELSFGPRVAWEPRAAVVATPKDREQTDIKRLVRSVVLAAERAGIPEPRKAWLPELRSTIDLRALATTRRDDELTFAVGDRPEAQDQPLVSFRPDAEGNIAFYGTGGTGKSTALRTLAIAAGLAVRGGPCHVYGIDFGSRGLAMLESLPHVGSVIPGGDHERISRLLTWLRSMIDERAQRYSAVSASTITEYRAKADEPSEPRVLLLLDGVAAFRSAYETTDRARYLDLLTSIASEGRPVGVHVALSSDQRSGIHTALASAVQRRVVLRMAASDDYGLLGVPSDVLNVQSPRGRALDGELELQVATIGGQEDAGRQAAEVTDLAAALRAAGAVDAPAIRSLPDVVKYDSTRRAPGREVLIGIASATLDSIGVDARGGFLVTGPPSSGRSAALRLLLRSAADGLGSVEAHYFGPRRSELASWPGWFSRSHAADDVAAQATSIATSLESEQSATRRILVVVESASDYALTTADVPLAALAKLCIAEDHWFVVEGELSTLKTGAGFLGVVKSSRRGLALQPDAETGVAMFNTALPRFNRADFPPGRGFLVGAGKVALVQAAWTDAVDG